MQHGTQFYEMRHESIVIERLRLTLDHARRTKNNLTTLKTLRRLEQLGCRVGFEGGGR